MGRRKRRSAKWTMLYKREAKNDDNLQVCIYEPLHKGELNRLVKQGWQQLSTREGR